jgi:glycosyltransferase involved in cell wall biosynthesis
MLGKKLGGIEQAFIDYSEACALKNQLVICVIRKRAKIIFELESLKNKYPDKIIIERISNLGSWDFFSKIKIYFLLKKYQPKLVICHGNRPSGLFSGICKKNKIKMVSVVHNYWFKDVLKADYLFCVSNDIKSALKHYFPEGKIFKIPNLIRLDKQEEGFLKYSNFREGFFADKSDKVKIGVLARMVEKKGVDYFVKACKILKDDNFNFEAVIGGDGELVNEYQSLRDDLKLNQQVRFIGWVKDKKQFYNDIDIFCLPSLSEPFGIVLLEAMKQGVPVIASNLEGPAEILTNKHDAILVEPAKPEQIAQAIKFLANNRSDTLKITENAYITLKQNYELKSVAKQLSLAIEQVINSHE